MKLRLSPATRYFALNKKETNKGSVHPGQFVGFLQKNGLITELHLVKPGPPISVRGQHLRQGMRHPAVLRI